MDGLKTVLSLDIQLFGPLPGNTLGLAYLVAGKASSHSPFEEFVIGDRVYSYLNECAS